MSEREQGIFVPLSDRELAAVKMWREKRGIATDVGVMRQALRVYDSVQHRAEQGRPVDFSNPDLPPKLATCRDCGGHTFDESRDCINCGGPPTQQERLD